jgi:hypothetical protein
MAMQVPGRRPIGQILKDAGFLSQHQLELALQEQQRSNEKLGEILVRMGLLEAGELQAALSLQGHLSTVEQAVRLGAGVRQMLGALLVASGKLSAGELEQVLAEQKRRGGRLGELCVGLGLLSQPQLDALLAFQRHQEERDANPHPLRLGELLVSAGYLTREQLVDALARQRPGQRLGETLVEAGYAQPAQISHAVSLQRLLGGAALAALLSLATVSLSGCGAGGASSGVAATAPTATSAVASASAPPSGPLYPAPMSAATPPLVQPAAGRDYFTVTDDDYGLIRPNFYYSTDNDSFWSIQANVARGVTDSEAVAVYRIDIPKNAGPLPPLNRTFSIEEGTGQEKFPGEFLVLNGAKSGHKKVERGTITFTPDSTAGGRVTGSFDVTLTDYDGNMLPAPQYRLKGNFCFVMGSYGPAPSGG